MNRNHKLITGLALLSVAIAATAWIWRIQTRVETMGPGSAATATKPEREVLYWHDPMVPGPKFDKPGKSPFMDMQLVPVYADESSAEGGAPIVTVRPEVINNLGVRSYTVERKARPQQLTVEGYLFRDEEHGGISVLADIFDRDADWVRAGLPAEVRVLDFPGRRWTAAVQSIGRDIDIGTRSLKAVIRLKTPDQSLKPNMFAEVSIAAPPVGKKLYVPREVLIRTGTRTALVLALGKGRFRPVEVVTGAEHGEWVEIVKGVNEGDSVVTSGQFLIDSESSLRASFQRMEGAKEPSPPATEKESTPGPDR